jgi:hypothetical protein
MVTPSGLLVLDLDQLTLRCRSCDWVSPTCKTVEDAAQNLAAHTCSPREIAPGVPGQLDRHARSRRS